MRKITLKNGEKGIIKFFFLGYKLHHKLIHRGNKINLKREMYNIYPGLQEHSQKNVIHKLVLYVLKSWPFGHTYDESKK